MALSPVFKSVEQFSKVLAQENITVAFSQSAKTASFNTDQRVLTLPSWNGLGEDAVDMLVAHEVGHALHTPNLSPEEIMATNVPFAYLNIVEDIRIDDAMQKEFRGLKGNYRRGWRQLHNEFDMFQIRKDRIDIDKLILIDRINIYAKLSRYDVYFKPHFTKAEKALLNKALDVQSFDDVIAVAREIYEFTKENELQQEQPQQQPPVEQESAESDVAGVNQPSGDNEEQEQEPESVPQYELPEDKDESKDDEESGSDGTNEDESKDDEESGEDKTDGDSKQETESEDEAETDAGVGSEKGEDSKDDDVEGEEGVEDSVDSGEDTDVDVDTEDEDGNGDGEKSSQSGAHNSADSITDENIQRGLEELTTESARLVVVNIPKLDIVVDSNSKVIDYMTDRVNSYGKPEYAGTYQEEHAARKRAAMSNGIATILNMFRNDSKKQVQMMVKRFNQKQAAEAFRRTEVGKRGELDTNRLWAYRTADNLFAKRNIVKDGKSHGLVMLVDGSGSMHGLTLAHTIRQVYALTQFCDQVKIPYDVHMFFSDRLDSELNWSEQDVTKGNVTMSNGWLANIITSHQSKTARDKQWKALVGYGLFNWAFGHTLGIQGFSYNSQGNNDYNGRYSLGSTPLDYSLLAIDSVIQKFKNNHGVEKVHLAVLTDGDSDASSVMVNNRQRYLRFDYFKGVDIVVNDTVSKKTFTAEDLGLEKTKSVLQFSRKTGTQWVDKPTYFGTALAVKILKKRLPDVNVVGFFLLGDKKGRSLLRGTGLLADFNKGFAEVEGTGFDAYYYVAVETEEETALDDVKKDATANSLAKAFVKSASSDSVRSAFLNRFIDLIV